MEFICSSMTVIAAGRDASSISSRSTPFVIRFESGGGVHPWCRVDILARVWRTTTRGTYFGTCTSRGRLTRRQEATTGLWGYAAYLTLKQARQVACSFQPSCLPGLGQSWQFRLACALATDRGGGFLGKSASENSVTTRQKRRPNCR